MDQELVRQLPKVELHCHLDGSVSMALLERLAREQDYPLENLKKATVSPDIRDLAEYLQCFDIILDLLQTADQLQRAVVDVAQQAAADSIRYIEIRFAPYLHTEGGLTIQEVIAAVVAGAMEAEAQLPIKVNLLICGMKHHDTARNQTLIPTILQQQATSSHVVGIDFAGDEASHPPEEIAQLVTAAQQQGIAITLHAGECGCAQNVVESIKLGAKRIGHGIAIMNDPAAREFVRQQQVLLEMCPTSNLQTKAIERIEEFPIKQFLQEGVPCSLSTDNRGVSQTDLTREYQLLFDHCGLTLAEMKKMNLDGLAWSFADKPTKEQLSAAFTAAYDQAIMKSE